MADGVAVLGLQVDASGALVELKKFDDATKKTGDTATKTQAQVAGMAGGFKAVDGTVLSSYEALRKYEAALNRAANVGRRAEQMARELALAEQAQAAAAAQATAATAAAGTAAGGTEAAFNRIRGSLTGLLSPILGTVGGFNALTSTIGSLALGNVVTVGLLAGVAAIGLAYTALTEKTKALKEETDKARKALEDLARQQRQGVAGDLPEQIRNQAKALAELEQKLAAVKARSVGGFSQAKIGVISDTDLADTRAKAAEIAKIEEAIAAGRRELVKRISETNREYSQSQTESLATLVRGNAATVAEQEKASQRLKNLQADLAASIQSGGDPAARVRLIEDIKKLNDALNPSTAKADAAAKREEAAAVKALAKAFDEAQDSVEKYQAGLSKGRLDAFDKAEATAKAQAKAADDARKAQDAQTKSANDLLDPLRFQVDLIGKTKAQVEQLTDLENYRLAIARGLSDAQAEEYVQLQRALRAQTQATEDWKAALSEVVGIVQLIGTAFGDVGREITKAGAGVQSIITGLQKANAAKGTGGFGGEGGLSGPQAVSTVGIVAGGVFTLVDALNSLNKSAEKAAQRAKDLSDAYVKQFEAARKLVDVRTDSSSAIGTDTASLNDAAGRAFGAAIKAAVKAKDNAAIGAALLAYQQALDDIATFAADRAKDIEAQQKKLEGFTKDNDVLALRIQGRNDEADAMQVQIEIERKYEEAVDLYGRTAETARYKTLLLAQATDEAAKAAIRKAEAERRSITDLTNGARAFTDPRGAGQAAFEETQRRRLSDAIERNASAAELAAINLYNLAEAADRAAQIAEQDLRTQESLIARVLGTLGNDRATQDFVTGANQRQEIADAIRNGMSPTNLAFLQFTQRVENSYTQMQRAIEDGTKAIQDRAKNEIAAIDVLIEVTQSVAKQQIAAIDAQIKETQTLAKATAKAYDEQISAIREQTKAQLDAIDVQIEAARGALDAANATVNALDKQVQTNLKVVETLQQFSDSIKLGDLSTLSPEGKLAEARRQFEALASAAQGGNADAATQLPGAAQALLQASRAFNASGPGFVNDFNRVNDIIAQLTQQFGATLPIDQQQLEAARQSVTALQATVDALGKQKDTISKASDAQIAVLQKAKDKAAEDAQRVIDKLQENKQKIQDDTQRSIDKLQETKRAIEDAAQRQIDELVRVQTEAHLTRLRQDEYWQQFLGTGATQPTGNGPETFPGDGTTVAPTLTVTHDQLAAQRETNEKLDALQATLSRLLGVTATANDEEVDATVQTTAAVQNVAQQIRQLGQALVARSR